MLYEVITLRIQRSRDDIKVMIRYADQQRSSLAGFEEMRIRTAEGRESYNFA